MVDDGLFHVFNMVDHCILQLLESSRPFLPPIGYLTNVLANHLQHLDQLVLLNT